MKKTTLFLIGGCIVGAALASAIVARKEMQKMRELEDELDAMPLYKIKSKLARVQEEKDKYIIEVPKATCITNKMKDCMISIKEKVAGCCKE